jgi:propanol-preferring alcohol dehydrogenase
MRAWEVHAPGPVSTAEPLRFVQRDDPLPAPGQIRVRVTACGVCRTDLHVAEGDLPVHRERVIPGHEVVGRVDMVGAGSHRFTLGDRVGIAWLRRTCGRCRWCRRGRENLCAAPRFTGWDDDGGYAELAVVDEDFAYRLPAGIDDEHVAPLLCAGIIGLRALRLADLPAGGVLGIYGFGASAHLTAQVAMRQGARVHVLTRSTQAQQLALGLGASSAGGASDPPPEPLDSAILFAPAGELVPVALRALGPGGTLAVAGIHLTDIPRIDYDRELFRERVLRSVTANTRADGEDLLALAERLDVHATTRSYPLDAADRALRDLAADRVNGAAVLRV